MYLFGLGLNGPWQDILLTISDSASLILSLWVYATILLYIAASLSKAETEKINFAAINQRAWSILLTLFIAQLLIMLAAALGFILLIIPGLIIWTWTAFASQEIVLNARSLWEAFKVSRSYTKGRLWPILGRLIVGNGLLSLAMVTVFAVYVLLGSQGHLNAAITSLNTLPTWTQVGTDILALPFIPPLIIFQLLLYVEVKKGYSQDQT